jgi:hypothetical protein
VIYGFHADPSGTAVGDYAGEILCPPGMPCTIWDPFTQEWEASLANNADSIYASTAANYGYAQYRITTLERPFRCAAQALKENGVGLALDGVGFIPGGQLFDLGVGIVGTVVSAAQEDETGAFLGIVGIHATALAPVIKAVERAAPIINVLATANDLVNTYQAYSKCTSEQ